jgi:hypothetical protein
MMEETRAIFMYFVFYHREKCFMAHQEEMKASIFPSLIGYGVTGSYPGRKALDVF